MARIPNLPVWFLHDIGEEISAPNSDEPVLPAFENQQVAEKYFAFDDGDIIVSSKPGLGIELDEDKLKHYRIS